MIKSIPIKSFKVMTKSFKIMTKHFSKNFSKMGIFLLLSLLLPRGVNAEVACKTKLQTFFLKHIYEITLCKEKEMRYEDIFKNTFSIELDYRMSSSGNWIGKRSLSEIQKHYNLTESEEESYRKHFENFFPNVEEGDKILLKFDPKLGAKFYYNGVFFGEIKDIEFAIRTGNIWLHPDASFKDTRNFLFSNE
jgi:hypothetical protein